MAIDASRHGRLTPSLIGRPCRPTRAGFAWVSLCAFALWLEPSVGQLLKYLGPYGTIAVACVAALLIGFTLSWLGGMIGSPRPMTSRRPLFYIAMLMITLFVVLFPVSRSGLIGGGSDRADALNVALRALLAGHQPYRTLTYLGNPPTPMPGALLLASPFYFLGSSALQNLFWLPVFVALCPSMIGDRRAATVFMLMFIVLCPGAMQYFVTGGDYLVNVIYIVV